MQASRDEWSPRFSCRKKSVLVFSALILTCASNCQAVERIDWPPAGEVEDSRVERYGLRVIRSQHCTLVTDLKSSSAIDELAQLVDAAVPLWRDRFGVSKQEAKAWRVRVCLIDDEARFEAAGLMPVGRTLDKGLALGHEVWLREQPSDYYRRCLLLHEGTHSFMMTSLGGCGPAWYMEGIAELLGAHDWMSESSPLRLGVIPTNKLASPMWGRIKLIRDSVAKSEVLPLEAVMKIDNRAVLSVESYAWVWALAVFCEKHPEYRARWRSLHNHVLDDEFNKLFLDEVIVDRVRFAKEWRYFLGTIDYGYDLPREEILWNDGELLAEGGKEVRVEAGRGWQSSGVRVEKGKRYRLLAEGRFVINREADGQPWPCEPGGVTLAYHRGRPLGEFLVTTDSGPNAFLHCEPIGLGGDYLPEHSGTLYCRINDAPNRLAENEGSLVVTISVD